MFFISHLRECLLFKRLASLKTSVDPTRGNLVPRPLAVLSLNNRLYIIWVYILLQIGELKCVRKFWIASLVQTSTFQINQRAFDHYQRLNELKPTFSLSQSHFTFLCLKGLHFYYTWRASLPSRQHNSLWPWFSVVRFPVKEKVFFS